MTTLADHWEGGYLRAGWHHVEVTEHRLFDAKSGNSGVEFEMKSTDTGSKAKEGFMLLDNCLWRLAAFARACGLTREQAAKYDPMNQNHHRKLHGLECWIEMVQDGKYHKVSQYRSLAEGRGTDTVVAPEPAGHADYGAGPASDDIPF